MAKYRAMAGKYGQGKPPKVKGGDPVSFAQVGNVTGGSYSDAKDNLSMAAYNSRRNSAPAVKGSHRKTHSVGVPKGHHRNT